MVGVVGVGLGLGVAGGDVNMCVKRCGCNIVLTWGGAPIM